MATDFRICLAHILSSVKTIHHAKFQKNSPTGLARMMVQTYRQTSPYIYIYIYIYTSSIYPALPGQYRLKSSSWPGSGTGRGCLSGGGHGYLVVVAAPVSQWWWSVSPRVFLAKISFLAFSRYHGNHFANF